MPASRIDAVSPAGKPRQRGFTLVEIIIVLVVAGFFGVLMVNMLGTQLLRSATPVATAQSAARAEATMEQIVSCYVTKVNSGTSGALAAVKTQFPANATLVYTENAANTFGTDGTPSYLVTVTEGNVSLTTLLTQQRTNSADKAVTF